MAKLCPILLMCILFVFVNYSLCSQNPYRDLTFSGDGLFEMANRTGMDNPTFVKNTPAGIFSIYTESVMGITTFHISKSFNSGERDSTFGINGYARKCYSFDPWSNEACTILDLFVQPNGKIVIVSNQWNATTFFPRILVTRIFSDGNTDYDFGADGIRIVKKDNETFTDYFATSCFMNSQGNIIISANRSNSLGYLPHIVRLNNNGSNDITFANNGFYSFPDALVPGEIGSPNGHIIHSIVSHDSKILASCIFVNSNGQKSSVLIALSSNGTRIQFENDNAWFINLGLNDITNLKIVGNDLLATGMKHDNNTLLTGYFSSSYITFNTYVNTISSFQICLFKMHLTGETISEFGSDGWIYFPLIYPNSSNHITGWNILENAIFFIDYFGGVYSFLLNSGDWNESFGSGGSIVIETQFSNPKLFDINFDSTLINILSVAYHSDSENNDVVYYQFDENGNAIVPDGLIDFQSIDNIYNVPGNSATIFETPSGNIYVETVNRNDQQFYHLDDNASITQTVTISSLVPNTPNDVDYISEFSGNIIYPDNEYLFGTDQDNSLTLFNYSLLALPAFDPALIHNFIASEDIAQYHIRKKNNQYFIFVIPQVITPICAYIFKVNQNFEFDLSFGENGCVTLNPVGTDFAGFSEFIIQEDGTIYLFGHRYAYINLNILPDYAICTRVNMNGDLDLTYGDYGNFTFESFEALRIKGAFLAADNSMYCLLKLNTIPYTYDTDTEILRIFKFNSDGTLSASFNSNLGYVDIDFLSNGFTGPDLHDIIYSDVDGFFYAVKTTPMYFPEFNSELFPNSDYTSNIIRFNEVGIVDATFQITENIMLETDGSCDAQIVPLGLWSPLPKFTEIKLNFEKTKIYAYTTSNSVSSNIIGNNAAVYRFVLNPSLYGCTNPAAVNYSEEAVYDNGTCIIYGCTDPNATNYNDEATIDDGSCTYIVDNIIDEPNNEILLFIDESNHLNIKCSTVPDEICLHDNIGRLILKKTSNQGLGKSNSIELPTLSTGAYYIQCTFADKIETRIVINTK